MQKFEYNHNGEKRLKGWLKIIAICATMVFSSQLHAQSNKLKENFNKQFKIVRKLEAYSNAAWYASQNIINEPDSIKKQLSSDWFCIPGADKSWNVYYGKWNNLHYMPLVHYVVDENWQVKKQTVADTAIIESYAYALQTAKSHYSSRSDIPNIDVNWFILKDNGYFNVIVLPAIQVDGSLVYGYEYHMLISASDLIMRETMYYSTDLVRYRPDTVKSINLKYEQCAGPPVGAIYFSWYYRRYFKSIMISCKRYMWSLMNIGDGQYFWGVINKKRKKKNKLLNTQY